MTRGIQIGENSILAGRTSQLWTHSFYHQETGPGRYMIGAPIEIGDNCYIGSAVIICPGVSIVNGVTVGAGAVIGKSIERAGCYVGQPNRFFEFHPDDAILRYI